MDIEDVPGSRQHLALDGPGGAQIQQPSVVAPFYSTSLDWSSAYNTIVDNVTEDLAVSSLLSKPDARQILLKQHRLLKGTSCQHVQSGDSSRASLKRVPGAACSTLHGIHVQFVDNFYFSPFIANITYHVNVIPRVVFLSSPLRWHAFAEGLQGSNTLMESSMSITNLIDLSCADDLKDTFDGQWPQRSKRLRSHMYVSAEGELMSHHHC